MLRGSIIGLGKIAQTGHLPAFGNEHISGLAELVAGVDPKKESREIAGRHFPQLRLYEHSLEMSENEKIDFVDICAPPQFHAELIESAIQHRVHILCEKPFVPSVRDADRIRDILRRSGHMLAFVPCHQYRYSPLWQHFKRFLDDTGSHATSFLQFNVFRTGADPGLHSSTKAWRTDPSISGGGILADTGVHYLYLSLWMMGMPVKVAAHTGRLSHAPDGVEDTAIAVLDYGSSIVEINLTWAADKRANSARIVNNRGSIVYDGARVTRASGSSTEELPAPDASDKSHYVGMYVDLIREFVDRIQGSKSTSDWIEEAYRSIQLLHACYRAAETGSTITVNHVT